MSKPSFNIGDEGEGKVTIIGEGEITISAEQLKLILSTVENQ